MDDTNPVAAGQADREQVKGPPPPGGVAEARAAWTIAYRGVIRQGAEAAEVFEKEMLTVFRVLKSMAGQSALGNELSYYIGFCGGDNDAS